MGISQEIGEIYLATATDVVKCYNHKEDCVAGRGMPECAINAGAEVLLSIWDNILRVAQGRLRNGPQTLVWMSLEALNIIGKEPLPAFLSPCMLEARHSNGQASVAWFHSAIAAVNDPHNYDGTMPNGEQVELINDNADGQHVYATVRWRSQDVAVRTVHLRNLPVQLLNQDGQSQVALFESLIAGQRNTPTDYLPNGTRATVENANLDGNYTLVLLNLPMGSRVARSVDLHGLPQRNLHTPAGAAAPATPVHQAGHHQCQPQPAKRARVTPQPPAPPMLAEVTPAQRMQAIAAQVMPVQQFDFLLYSEVGVRHVEGKPVVGYYFEKTSAQLMGTPDGTIPSDSTALLLQLDASNQGGDGHCKIKWKHNGCQLDVYVRQVHIFSRS
jgi:hypothetical protein